MCTTALTVFSAALVKSSSLGTLVEAFTMVNFGLSFKILVWESKLFSLVFLKKLFDTKYAIDPPNKLNKKNDILDFILFNLIIKLKKKLDKHCSFAVNIC